MKTIYKERLVKNKTGVGENWLRSSSLIYSDYCGYVSHFLVLHQIIISYNFGVAINFVI